MKLTKIVMGCALAAGLMAFASQAAVAATFIGANGTNTLWTPFSVSGKVTYQEVTNGAFKTHSISSKDLLKDIGFSKDVSFALGTNNQVWVYNTKTDKGLVNLSAGGTNASASVSIVNGALIQNSNAKNGTVTRNEAGAYLFLTFNSTVGAASGQPTIVFSSFSSYDYSSKASTKELSDKLDAKGGWGYLSVSGITVTGTSPITSDIKGSGKLKL